MYIELAKKYLAKSRNASGSTKSYFANLSKVCLAKCAGSSEDIGSSDKEIAELTQAGNTNKRVIKRRNKKNPVNICEGYLEKCRNNDCTNKQYFANLCQSSLVRFNLKPEDIGCTAEELKNLQSQGFLESAKKYLLQARQSEGAKRKCYADLCSEYLYKGQGNPADIGCEKEELAELSM